MASRDHLARIADFDAVGASFISHDRNDLDNPGHGAEGGGGAGSTWTIRSAAQEAEARHVADNIVFEDYMATTPIAAATVTGAGMGKVMIVTGAVRAASGGRSP